MYIIFGSVFIYHFFYNRVKDQGEEKTMKENEILSVIPSSRFKQF